MMSISRYAVPLIIHLIQVAQGGKRVATRGGGTLCIWDDNMVHTSMSGASTLAFSLILLVPFIILLFVENKHLVVTKTDFCGVLLAAILATMTRCCEHEIIMAVSA